MSETAKPFCFVIMPFSPELHYFYLYLKQHIEQKHRLDCERADAQILTVPLLDKINDYISRADVIIADLQSAQSQCVWSCVGSVDTR